MTAAKAFQHIVQTCVRQFRLNENLLSDGRQPEALHQVRIALRRLRSAFSIFRAMLDQDVSPGLRDELRWLASELGEARNLDVLLARSQPGPLHDRLETARVAAYAAGRGGAGISTRTGADARSGAMDRDRRMAESKSTPRLSATSRRASLRAPRSIASVAR